MEDGEAISRLGLKSIKCILCHQVSSCTLLTPPPQVILLAELPPTQYITHLMSAHEVLFDLEFLVQRTLQQQHPELAKSAAGCCIDKTGKPAAPMESGQRRSLEENASRMQEIFPQSITITPILKRKGSEERSDSKRRRGGEDEEVVINGDAEEEVAKSPTECEPSWSLGCLYRCAICSVKFQTLTSFQSHLFFHRTTPEQYLAQHGESKTIVKDMISQCTDIPNVATECRPM